MGEKKLLKYIAVDFSSYSRDDFSGLDTEVRNNLSSYLHNTIVYFCRGIYFLKNLIHCFQLYRRISLVHQWKNKQKWRPGKGVKLNKKG